MSKIEYSDLLFEISKKLDENELPRLIFMCREEIAEGSEENIRDVLTLFKELEKQNRLGIDRLDTLKEILKQMKKRSLLKKVEEFEIRRKGIQILQSQNVRLRTCKLVMPEVSLKYHVKQPGNFFSNVISCFTSLILY